MRRNACFIKASGENHRLPERLGGVRQGLVRTLLLFPAAAFALLFSIGSQDEGVFPELPDYIPPASVSAGQSPGGAALPPIGGEARPDAPCISVTGSSAAPGDSLSIAGDNLSGAVLHIWSEGEARTVVPVRSGNDRIQAVFPDDMDHSTALIWPLKDGVAGSPVRINAPEVWWFSPSTVKLAGELSEVRVFGRNLSLPGRQPAGWLRGPGIDIPVSERSIQVEERGYAASVFLPADLAEGDYELYLHNGSGGLRGWSDPPVRFSVHEEFEPTVFTRFEAGSFGAVADDGEDDWPALQSAVDAAAASGGGEVLFSPGTYHLSRPLIIPSSAGGGVHLRGAGKGLFDAGAENDLLQHTLAGVFTALYPLEGHALSEIIRIEKEHSSLSDMVIFNIHEGTEYGGRNNGGMAVSMTRSTVRGYSAGLRLKNLRILLADGRPALPMDERPPLAIYDAAMHLAYPGRADMYVEDCDLHTAGAGLYLGWMQYEHTSTNICAPSLDGVYINRCEFVGYSGILYRYVPGSLSAEGDAAHGIYNVNAKRVSIENSLFRGADRTGGRCFDRAILNRNTSIREMYIAENTILNTGAYPDPGSAMHAYVQDGGLWNKGEQILFHYRYPHGGYFDVIHADPTHVVLNPGDPRNAGSPNSMGRAPDRRGSRIPPEVGSNTHWLLYVAAGKGAGQVREVAGRQDSGQEVILSVKPGWRVVPDTESRVLLFVANRQNAVVNNRIDPGRIHPQIKTGGVQFWLNAVDNVVAGNRCSNTSYGYVFNSSFRNPCLWNLVEENEVNGADGFTGGGTPNPAGICFSYYRSAEDGVEDPVANDLSDCQGWYTVGNQVRRNRIDQVHTGVFCGVHVGDFFARTYLSATGGHGLVMNSIEHNHIRSATVGVEYDCGTTWLLIRNNELDLADADYRDRSPGKTDDVHLIRADGS